ncbi:hypothetical protein B0H16DRAFT_1604341 [Mycena metata]|uniref:Uncharacterized protein n=1 Tax=Mycena metata TaxID=1033252 RepID=A0AAD7HHX0_9AGAR|nr:hypothetical protein B0H16DRAFT_1604341 [Mycena metata]
MLVRCWLTTFLDLAQFLRGFLTSTATSWRCMATACFTFMFTKTIQLTFKLSPSAVPISLMCWNSSVHQLRTNH